jgi:hypothetical protein
MRIICINNSGIINGPIELITINKTYDIIKFKKGQYFIKDNSGEERWYNDNRFKDMAIVRQEKLQQIGI